VTCRYSGKLTNIINYIQNNYTRREHVYPLKRNIGTARFLLTPARRKGKLPPPHITNTTVIVLWGGGRLMRKKIRLKG